MLLPLPLLCCAVEMTNGSLSASLHITASHTAWCVCCTLFDIILCGCRMTLLYHSICRSLSVYLTCLHLLAVSCEPFRGSGTRFVAFKAVFLGKDWSIGKKSPTDHQQTVLRHCWQSPCQWQAGRGDIFDWATACKRQWGVPDPHAACIRTVSRGTSTCLKPQMLRLLQLLFFQESTWSMSLQCLPLDTSALAPIISSYGFNMKHVSPESSTWHEFMPDVLLSTIFSGCPVHLKWYPHLRCGMLRSYTQLKTRPSLFWIISLKCCHEVIFTWELWRRFWPANSLLFKLCMPTLGCLTSLVFLMFWQHQEGSWQHRRWKNQLGWMTFNWLPIGKKLSNTWPVSQPKICRGMYHCLVLRNPTVHVCLKV